MKHKTKKRWDKKSVQREEGICWRTRRSRKLDKEQREDFEKMKKNKKYQLD